MDIKKQKILLYIVGILSLFVVVSFFNFSSYIDVPSAILVLGAFIGSRYIYVSNRLSTFLLGIGVFVLIISLVAILVSMNDFKFVYPSIAVALLSFMYFVVAVIYISNVKEIYLEKKVDLALPKRTKSFWVAQLGLGSLFLLAMLMGVGLGAYIDIPSLLLFVPAIMTLYQSPVKSKYSNN